MLNGSRRCFAASTLLKLTLVQILDWDRVCAADPGWQIAQGINSLARKGQQPFYSSADELGGRRCTFAACRFRLTLADVAEDNIEPLASVTFSEIQTIATQADMGRRFAVRAGLGRAMLIDAGHRFRRGALRSRRQSSARVSG